MEYVKDGRVTVCSASSTPVGPFCPHLTSRTGKEDGLAFSHVECTFSPGITSLKDQSFLNWNGTLDFYYSLPTVTVAQY